MADSAIPAALTRRNFRRFMALFVSWSRDQHKSSAQWGPAASTPRIRMPPIARVDQFLFSFDWILPSSKRNIRLKYELCKTEYFCARLEASRRRPAELRFIPAHLVVIGPDSRAAPWGSGPRPAGRPRGPGVSS